MSEREMTHGEILEALERAVKETQKTKKIPPMEFTLDSKINRGFDRTGSQYRAEKKHAV